MEIGSKHIIESMIDSRIVANGSVKEYQDRVVEFSHKEGVDLMKSLKTF